MSVFLSFSRWLNLALIINLVIAHYSASLPSITLLALLIPAIALIRIFPNNFDPANYFSLPLPAGPETLITLALIYWSYSRSENNVQFLGLGFLYILLFLWGLSGAGWKPSILN